MTPLKFYLKPACSTCRKARRFLGEQGATLEEVDLNGGVSEADLEALIGERDYKLFLNTRNELYRAQKMKASPPSRQEAIRLMSRYPNLIRRPILVRGNEIVLGWDEEAMRRLIAKTSAQTGRPAR